MEVMKYRKKTASTDFVMSVMDLGRGVQAPQIDSSNFSVRRVCSNVWASSGNRQT
jgi:hypothetical protein